MGARSLEITLISARDLKNTSMFSKKTKAYAVAWISDDQKTRQRTPVDKYRGTDPTWNHVINFTLNEASLQQDRLVLEIAIYSGAIFCDKKIGHVSIPLKEFLEPAGGNGGSSVSAQFSRYQVRKSSGKAEGVLSLSVKLAGNTEVKPQQQQA